MRMKKIFSNNCGCNFVFYEIAIFQIVTLQGKLNRAGDLQISKLGKNFFSKVYLYDVRDNPPNDLGLITPKCSNVDAQKLNLYLTVIGLNYRDLYAKLQHSFF